MRKLHKKSLAELLETLKEANAELPKPENIVILDQLVKSIKEFAEVIKNYIGVNVSDENENKETAMNALDIYAERLRENVGERLCKSLKQQLNIIEIEISKFRVTQFEVVFIVSSAAKSDSLLPVYEAAAADPACIAHWMPVPLYKINEKHEILEKTFDGPDNYPGITSTDFHTYNFAKMCPDVIVVNDITLDNNFITELPKMFWVSNLKKYTDCLVYIPYFVFGANTREDDFVREAGLEYPDLIFVENEKVKNYYISANKPVFGNNFNYLKFIALGSPKFDSAINANDRFKSGELKISDEWRKKIYRNDGSKKTVVFLNTSLTNLLADVPVKAPQVLPGSNYLDILKTAIDMLSCNDNIVILWRPHPLFSATLKSMRPWLYEKWQEIVDDFKARDFGIYDDSGALDTAIAVSDALYGDRSSIASIFESLNKKIIKDPVYFYPYLIDMKWAPAVRCCGDLYIKSNFTSPILKFDTDSRKMHFVDFLEGEKLHNQDFHMFYISHNDKIYYLPANCKDLAVYNPKTGDTEHLELDIDYPVSSKLRCNMYFRNGFFYKDKLYLIPGHYNAIISYDFNEKKQEVCLDLRDILSEISYDDQTSLFWRYELIDEDKIVLPFVNSNDVLVYYLSDNSYKLYKIGTGTGFLEVFKYKDKLVLIESRQLLIWILDEQLNVISSFTDFPPDLRVDEYLWAFSTFTTILVTEKLFLFSHRSNMSVRINLDTMTAERILTLDKYISDNYPGVFTFAFYDEKVNKIFISTRSQKYFLEFDPDTLDVYEISMRIHELFDDETASYFTNKFIEEVHSECAEEKPAIKPCAVNIYSFIKKQVYELR